jgi:hypothetical protein
MCEIQQSSRNSLVLQRCKQLKTAKAIRCSPLQPPPTGLVEDVSFVRSHRPSAGIARAFTNCTPLSAGCTAIKRGMERPRRVCCTTPNERPVGPRRPKRRHDIEVLPNVCNIFFVAGPVLVGICHLCVDQQRVLGTVGRGHHRLCRTPQASRRQTSPSRTPKDGESWTPKHFSLQIGSFLETATVAMMAITDRSGRHPLRR